MSEFKEDDRVVVAEGATWGRNSEPVHALSLGANRIVSGRIDEDGDLCVESNKGFFGYVNYRFVTPEGIKPEVGDTVEVTYTDGTVVNGVVSRLTVAGGVYIGSKENVYVASYDVKDAVKITKNVEKPKVWVVGDVVEGGDYASETILPGTVAKDHNGPLVRVGDEWLDPTTGKSYKASWIFSSRTIVYIPEVSA